MTYCLVPPNPKPLANQCWNSVTWACGNILKWHFNRNSYIFIQENAFKNVVCKMMAILSWPRCVNWVWPRDAIWDNGTWSTFSLVSGYQMPLSHGPLARYGNCELCMRRKCREHFPPPPQVSNPDMHHSTCMAHVPWSLTSGFLWSRWQDKHSRHSWCMRKPQFYVSSKRPIT